MLIKRYGCCFKPEWAVVSCNTCYWSFGTVGSFLGICICMTEEIGYGQ